MADTSSTTTFKADISSLRAEMQAAARVVRVANSEFKAATAGMDNWSESADGLEAKIKQLDTVLKAQNRQVELAAEELEKTEKEYGENSAAADRARIKYNNFKAAAAQTEKELNEYREGLEDVEDATVEVENATKDASEGFTIMKGVLADLAASAVKAGIRGIKNLAVETFKAGSNFEAAMSQVEAVSGASAEEIEALGNKAKEMGSKTKFSATESAEAFNYMAMAGWKTQDMIDGIEGIMNLAAASGADLATTSDIVTDALTAMGYEAKDAGHLADVMAAASSNANTNVEMMGATFQYAAPLVGALGYNMEDTAVAIGMMANAGIKGEKAGTALRSILTRLSTGTGDAADAMDALGISLTKINDDGSTSMKSLDEVMRDLRVAFSDLDETQQTQYASMLAGQEAMSGLLAIVNGSDQDFENLTAAVAGSDGAAASMANTMNDNVAGALTLLQSNVEGKMIGVFEAAAPAIQEAIGKISEALDGVDWDKVAEYVGAIAQGFADFVTWALDNGDQVKGILEGIGGVLGTVFVIDKLSTFLDDIGKIGGAFIGLKGKITGTGSAGEAVGLFSAALGELPVLAVAAGILGLGVSVNILSEKWQEELEAEYGVSEEQQHLIEKIDDLKGAYDRTIGSRENAFKSIDSETGYLQDLYEEYGTLIDTNGNVKQGYEDRANFITTTLAEALGVEQEQIQGSIDKNGELSQSILDLIEVKRAEAIMSASQDSYTEAINNRQDALDAYNEAVEKQSSAEEKYRQTQENLKAAQENLNEAIANDPRGSAHAAELYEVANAENEKAKETLDTMTQAVKDAEETYTGYNATIANYEGLSAALITGDTKKISTALVKMENNFKTAETGTVNSLQEQYKYWKKTYDDMLTAVENGATNISDTQLQETKAMVNLSKRELERLYVDTDEAVNDVIVGIKGRKKDSEQAGEELGSSAYNGVEEKLVGIGAVAEDSADEVVEKIEEKAPDAKNAGEDLGKNIYGGAGDMLVGIGAIGEQAGSKYASGAESKIAEAYAAGKKLADNAKSGTSGADASDSGVNFAQGFINGIGSLVQSAAAKARELVQSAISAARAAQKEGSPSKLTYESGVYFTQGYILGIVSEQKNLVSTVQGLVNTAVKELANVSGYKFSEAGQRASAAFMSAFDKQTNYMINKFQYLNQGQSDDFDTEIKRLQAERDKLINKAESKSSKKQNALQKKKDKAKKSSTKAKYQKQIDAERKANKKQVAAIEAQYKVLIDTQENYQNAYNKASSEMLADLQDALANYQTAAQDLVDSTITEITDRYDERYNNLISKQENLINKLKDAANLFEVSNAGVLMIGNIQDQTKQIREYTEKLRQVKNRVSADLFDQIAQYDVKEGTAFMNYLLGLSAAELDAYNQAYTEKLKAAADAGEIIYGQDIRKVASDYQSEIQRAFASLPAQLQELGNQAMQGFITGLGVNTDYMSAEIKTFIAGMINTFKSQLQINSPSKVTFDIGEYTGEGFVDGLMSLIRKAKSAAAELANVVSTPLDSITGSIGMIQGSVPMSQVSAGVVNNYNLVQNNNSPKSLSALETYQARRRQIALVKAFG